MIDALAVQPPGSDQTDNSSRWRWEEGWAGCKKKEGVALYKRDNFRKRVVILTFFQKKFFWICTRNCIVLYEMYKWRGGRGQKATENWKNHCGQSRESKMEKLENRGAELLKNGVIKGKNGILDDGCSPGRGPWPAGKGIERCQKGGQVNLYSFMWFFWQFDKMHKKATFQNFDNSWIKY